VLLLLGSRMLKIPEIRDTHNRYHHGIFLTWSLYAPGYKRLKKKSKTRNHSRIPPTSYLEEKYSCRHLYD
jgi:hypothetical protein